MHAPEVIGKPAAIARLAITALVVLLLVGGGIGSGQPAMVLFGLLVLGALWWALSLTAALRLFSMAPLQTSVPISIPPPPPTRAERWAARWHAARVTLLALGALAVCVLLLAIADIPRRQRQAEAERAQRQRDAERASMYRIQQLLARPSPDR